MIQINIVGDFCVSKLQNLQIGPELSSYLKASDCNIVNFEAPIYCESAKPIDKSGPSIFQDPLSISFLHKEGFCVFCLANNHTMDYGEAAFHKTILEISQIGTAITLGAGVWEEAYKVKYLDIKGKRIGLLNITHHEFGVLDDDSNSKKIGSAWMLHPIVDELILKAKNECDYLIVMPHAGQEHFSQPLPEIKTLYRHFIRMGADAVVGGHPHIIQPSENYLGKPIVYSLGNFIFDKNYGGERDWYYGLVAQLTFDEEGGINLSTSALKYDMESRIVDITNDDYIQDFLKNIDIIFNNPDNYSTYVEQECLKQELPHDFLFELSGYHTITFKKCFRLLLGFLKRKILLRPEPIYNKAHLINNIRCEAHRWVLSRIYESKYNGSNR